MAPIVRLTLLLAALTFAFLVAPAHAEDDDAGPEMGRSLDPDELTVGSEDPDGLEGGSRDPDDLVVGSEDPDDMVGGSEDPDDMVEGSEDPDALTGRSYELDDLSRDSGSGNLPDPMPQLVSEPPAPTFDDSPEVHAAWRAVQAAERNMEASNDVYTQMMENDYPRGERRERIIEERRAAFENVNRTRTHYMELLDR